MAQLAGKVSDETLERWQQFKQGHQGESFNDLIGMILDAADEKSLAAGHPAYAATLSAYDELAGKERDLLAGLVVAADEAVEKARADAAAKQATIDGLLDQEARCRVKGDVVDPEERVQVTFWVSKAKRDAMKRYAKAHEMSVSRLIVEGVNWRMNDQLVTSRQTLI